MEPVNVRSSRSGSISKCEDLGNHLSQGFVPHHDTKLLNADNCCEPAISKLRADIAWVFSGLQDLCISGLAGHTAQERLVNSMFVLMHGSASGSVARELWSSTYGLMIALYSLSVSICLQEVWIVPLSEADGVCSWLHDQEVRSHFFACSTILLNQIPQVRCLVAQPLLSAAISCVIAVESLQQLLPPFLHCFRDG